VASVVDIARVASFVSVRCEAKTMRPSLRGLTWAQRLKVPTTELGVPLCRVGALQVWTSLRNVITVFGGPGVGKTGWLAGRIIDAPGAVITTSTRLDLYDLTAPLRSTGDRPVFVFNPGGLGGPDMQSTITFDPLAGCEDPMTAVDRAADMIPDSGNDDGERWDAKARRNLAVLLHAAAVGGLSCATVADWVADLPGSEREILSALRRSPEPSFTTAAKQLLGLNDKTQSSIADAIMPAFGWLIDRDAVAAATGDNQLDVADLLQSRGTVYLLGREQGHTAPLLAALTGHITRASRKLAALAPGGRLDPSLTLALDEAARIAPVPAPDWTGDMGGSGVQLILAFQSRPDMINRWGRTGAARILNNSGAILVFGGTNDVEDLEAWSKRVGERDEAAHPPNRRAQPDTSKSPPRRVPVLSPAQIANLPARRVLVICRGMPPAIGRVKMAWKRPDVKAHLAHSKRTIRTAAAVVAKAERVTANTSPAPAPGRWVVDSVGDTHAPVGDDPNPHTQPALNGQANGAAGGAGDGTH
jgi:type IV secretory pathway TraG/TraD family ATPase VirD4